MEIPLLIEGIKKIVALEQLFGYSSLSSMRCLYSDVGGFLRLEKGKVSGE